MCIVPVRVVCDGPVHMALASAAAVWRWCAAGPHGAGGGWPPLYGGRVVGIRTPPFTRQFPSRKRGAKGEGAACTAADAAACSSAIHRHAVPLASAVATSDGNGQEHRTKPAQLNKPKPRRGHESRKPVLFNLGFQLLVSRCSTPSMSTLGIDPADRAIET